MIMKILTRTILYFIYRMHKISSMKIVFWQLGNRQETLLAEYGIGDIIIIAVEHGSQDRIQEYVFEDENKYAVKLKAKIYTFYN